MGPPPQGPVPPNPTSRPKLFPKEVNLTLTLVMENGSVPSLVLRSAQNTAPKTGYPQEKWAMGLEVTGASTRLLPAPSWRFQERVRPDPVSNTAACRGWAVRTATAEDRPCNWAVALIVQSLNHFRIFATTRMQHARLPWPFLSPRVCLNSCPLSLLCHPTISSSVAPFSSCSQSFPAPMSQLFISGGQSIGASASASVLPMNIQDYFPLGLTGLISLLSKGLSRVFSSTIVRQHQFFSVQLSLWSNSHICT